MLGLTVKATKCVLTHGWMSRMYDGVATDTAECEMCSPQGDDS